MVGSATKKAELFATVQLRLRLSVPAHDFYGADDASYREVRDTVPVYSICIRMAAEDLKVYQSLWAVAPGFSGQ